ncbi:hypothetical protein [Rubripirellula amarantea]|nr:hypothetical protein [Rubripirellula amarantea]
MKNQTLCLLLFACQALAGTVKADDALFSEIAMESVFSQSTPTSADVATPNGSTSLDRITGPTSLTNALKSAGFNPQPNKEAVSMKVERAGWKLPVSMTVDVEQDRITCKMSLVKIEKDMANSSKTLLALMSASNQTANASFVLDSSDMMLQLRTTFTNRDITTKFLKSEMASLADTAIAHSDTWRKLKSSSTLTSTSSATSSTSSGSSDYAPFVGKWSASLPSSVSIAIEFKADKTFKMVHLVGSKAAVSSGTMIRNASQLTLSEPGKADVQFQIESVTATSMKLRIVDSSNNPGTLLQFSKASS